MIARIQGVVEAVESDKALLTPPGSLSYELLLTRFTAGRLGAQIGQTVTFYTLMFFESQNQGATILPRLAGFETIEDRQFFELFVTVKGIGHRRSLRAMTIPTAQIVTAIVDRDLSMLQSLPEVGRRTAETITVTLRDKIEHLVSAATYPEGLQTGEGSTQAMVPASSTLARDALEVLLQLGERRIDAAIWIDQALALEAAPHDVEQLVAEVYRLKTRN